MHSSEEIAVPAYTIHINTSAFACKKSQLKERTQTEWMGHFWRKCGMDQKRISPSCEDRLSQLTTGQIDRIIDMERIRTILHDKKRKKQEVYLEYQARPNTHPHVYQANFLAKINAIAIRRNIRHEKSEGFDEYFGEQVQNTPGEKDKKTTQMPYKYIKKYLLEAKHPRNGHAINVEENDQKSIGSISDRLQDFEQRLENSRVQRSKRQREKGSQCSAMRWFNGMSNHYLRKDDMESSTIGDFQRMPSFDIEGELRQGGQGRPSVKRGRTEPSESKNGSEAFVKFKISRVHRVVSVK